MNNLKYVLYARKSTESEDRQVQSIDDQIRLMKQLADERGLNVTHIKSEARSAKEPYKRPVYVETLELIRNGEADAILCWGLDRLSRNPIDSGELGYLLQKEMLKHIQTSDRQYRPEDNVIIFNVESGQANQYIRDLSKNVKRGLESKVDKGWYTGVPPHGYENERIEHTIILDKERSWMIRKAFDLLFSNWSVREIQDHLNNELGFRSIQRKRSGGNKLGYSTLYSMLKNPFYAGYFRWRGEIKKGAHPPIITMEEHERIELEDARRTRAKAVMEAEKELHELLKLRTKQLIGDDEYKRHASELRIDIAKLKQARSEIELRGDDWLRSIEQKLDYARTAQIKYVNGTHEEKRDLLATFGQTFILENKVLKLTPVPWLVPIQEKYKELETAYLALEPEKEGNLQMKKAAFAAINSTWQGIRDDFQTLADLTGEVNEELTDNE